MIEPRSRSTQVTHEYTMEWKGNISVAVLCGLGCIVMANAVSCPDGWLSHRGACYIYSHTIVPWVDAVTLCNQMGGELAEINSAIEGLYLENTAKLLKTNFYIGAHDMLVPDKWEWINSKTTVNDTGYSNWAPGMPSSVGDHDCVFLESNDGRWVNGKCFTAMNFVCNEELIGTKDAYLMYRDTAYQIYKTKTYTTVTKIVK